MDRAAEVLGNLDCIEQSPSSGAHRAGLDETQAFERAIRHAYGTWVLAWLVAAVVAPSSLAGATASAGLFGPFQWVVFVGALGLGAMSAASALWMHLAYLLSRRRG